MGDTFLESFELIKEFRGIKSFKIDFKEGLNIIVGENGVGKSSICFLMEKILNGYGIEKEKYKEYVSLKMNEKVKVDFYDTEKNNPRIKSYFDYEKDVTSQINSFYVSHGQSNMHEMVSSSKSISNQIIIYDEPEAGISLYNQNRLSKYYNNNSKNNNNQIIIMTHSLPIISSVEQIYSLNDKEWISSFVYLNSVLYGTKIVVLKEPINE